MIIIGFYLMVFPLVVLAGDVATIKKRNSVSIINVDVTNTMEDVIGEMMNTFHKTSQQWYENQLILDLDEYRSEDEDMPSTQSKNYSISHGKIWMTQFLNEKNEMFSKISCQFSDTLEVRTIIPDFQFRGSFNMTNNENPTVLVYNYIVDIKNINLTFTTEPDFNIEDALPNNQSKVDISYGQVNINFETSDQDIRDDTYGFEELRERLKKIKSSLRTSIIEKLTSHIKSPIHSYVSLYSICMNPRNDITRYHRTFDSQEEQHYYEISDIPSASCDFLNLQVAPIKIRGLWNFDFLNVKLSKKEMPYRTYSTRCGRYIYSSNVYDFDLRIINIEGETKWVIKENIDYNVTKWNDLNFTIDYLSISGNTWECSSSNDIRVDFHLLLEDEDNSDYWSNLFRKMILKRIQPVLRNTFRKTIFKKFSQLESSNPYY